MICLNGNVLLMFRYDGKIPNKVKQATLNYVMDLEFDNPIHYYRVYITIYN